MKNSSQTQHHRSEAKRKEEQKIEENEAGSNGTVAREELCLNSAKIRCAGIFAIIAKITVHSKNFNFRYAQLFSL